MQSLRDWTVHYLYETEAWSMETTLRHIQCIAKENFVQKIHAICIKQFQNENTHLLKYQDIQRVSLER